MADGSRHSLYSVQEVTRGVTPQDPVLDTIRITGTTLGLSKDSLQSEEIRSDRQIADFRLGANQVAGDINFELSYGSFDQFLSAALMANGWLSPADTGVTSIDATTTGFDRATGDFLADGFKSGQTVVMSGYLDNNANGAYKLTDVQQNSITATPLAGQVQVNESGGGDERMLAAESIYSASERRYYSFVRNFADIDASSSPFYVYTGCEINAIQLSVSANSMITGTLSVVGAGQTTSPDLSQYGNVTYSDISDTSPLDSFTGSLEEAGTTIAVITDISLTLSNGLESRYAVGSKDSIDPSVGRSNLTGQIVAYFEDSRLVDKFLNEEESSISFTLPDGAGNFQRYTIPRIKYTGGQPDVSGEGSITLTMPFQALLDAETGSNFIIERVSTA